MRIGVLTTSFPRWEGDGAGAFVLGSARALAAREHVVEVLAPEPHDSDRAPEGRLVSVRWIPYLRPREWQRTFYGAGVPDNVRHDARAWPGLATFPPALWHAARKARSRWDAVLSHWAVPCGWIGGRIAGHRPHVAVFHSADVHALGRLPVRTRVARDMATGCRAMVFASPALQQTFLQWLPEPERTRAYRRSYVSAMGIDPPPTLRESRVALRGRFGFRRWTLLAMGRLVAVKGLDDAVRAVSGRDDVELVVAGDGPERARLERLARELAAPVRFFGFVEAPTKHEILAAADVFIAPSRPTETGRTEGTPTAVLEAMAAGLPVLATATGGLASFVQPERTGLLAQPGCPNALRSTLDRLLADHSLRQRLSRRGQALARHYAWPELAPWWERLFG